MDYNEIDLRLRAMEKKLKQFELYLRSPAFRFGRLIIVGILLLAALAIGGYYGRDYLKASHARIDRVDSALASNYPSYGSDYCRWVYDARPGYEDCLRAEQKAFIRFEAAWRRSQHLSALREQMITCFAAAQNEQGMSWKAAADCSELNDDLPEDAPPDKT